MTTPDQNEAREARDFPCCEDGEHVPAEIAGDLFTATLNRAQWHRVDEALAAHGRNDAVRGQIAVTKIAARPTPPEDVAAAIAYLTPIAESATVGRYGEMLRVALAALAAVPADGETEWTTEPDATHLRDLRADSRVRSSLDLIREANSVRDLDGTGIVGRLADMLAGWLPIPESEEQR